jgi:hypothetical protein
MKLILISTEITVASPGMVTVMLPHQPHCLALAVCDFYVFPLMIEWLKSCHREDQVVLKIALHVMCGHFQKCFKQLSKH